MASLVDVTKGGLVVYGSVLAGVGCGADVAVPERGESPLVTFDDPGSIRFYCSLHQDETWDVFVSPSPHFARLDRRGAYRIDNVPTGDYELSIWSAAVDGGVRTVHVGPGISALEPIWLDPAKIAR
jgi:hypothetical protein